MDRCGACVVNAIVNNPTPCCEDFVEPTCYGEPMCAPDDPNAFCDICGHWRNEHIQPTRQEGSAP